MNVFLGVLLIIWGMIIISSLYRMNNQNNKEKSIIGASGFTEWELLFNLLNRLPIGFMKRFVLIIGAGFITLGTFMI